MPWRENSQKLERSLILLQKSHDYANLLVAYFCRQINHFDAHSNFKYILLSCLVSERSKIKITTLIVYGSTFDFRAGKLRLRIVWPPPTTT